MLRRYQSKESLSSRCSRFGRSSGGGLQSKLSTPQLVSLIAAFAGAVALIAGASWYLSTPEYRLLFTDMDPEEASAVVSRLTTDKVQYRLAKWGLAPHRLFAANGARLQLRPPGPH